jgi:hypothetical protein
MPYSAIFCGRCRGACAFRPRALVFNFVMPDVFRHPLIRKR